MSLSGLAWCHAKTSIQGLFQMLGLPYVGCDQMVQPTAWINQTKLLLNCAGRPPHADTAKKPIQQACGSLTFACPCLSSLPAPTVRRHQQGQNHQAAGSSRAAFEYDDKVLIEEAIPGRNRMRSPHDGENIFCPPPGEVIPHDEFYSYTAKYLSRMAPP